MRVVSVQHLLDGLDDGVKKGGEFMAKVDFISVDKGMDTQPSISKNFTAPFLIENLDVDQTRGVYEKRKGYRTVAAPVHRNGELLERLHVNTSSTIDGYNKFFRYGYRESYVINGQLLIVAGGDLDEPQMYDTSNFREYNLVSPTLTNPMNYASRTTTGSTTVENYIRGYNNGDDSAGSRSVHNFFITWIFKNDRLGLRTPPAPGLIVQLEIDRRVVDGSVSGNNFRTFMLNPSIPTDQAPEWYQGIEIYFSELDYRKAVNVEPEEFSRIFDQTIRYAASNEDRIWVDINYLIDEWGMGFYQILDHTAVGSPAITSAEIQLDFVYQEQAAVEGDSEDETIFPKLDINRYPEKLVRLPKSTVPANLQSITSYAGRMWGYDPDENAIIMSYIDESGNSQYHIMPRDLEVPHLLQIQGYQQSNVTAMHPIPDGGGLYVFFRDDLKFIRGESLITGLHSLEIAPGTDIDASGGIPQFGTLSPNSIASYKDSVIFLGSDRRLYQLQGATLNNIGTPIQAFLDSILTDNLHKVVGRMHDDRFHLIVPNQGVFVLDIQYKYWTKYDLDSDLTSLVWSRGGDSDESVFYGLAHGAAESTSTTPDMHGSTYDSAAGLDLIEMYHGVDDNGTDVDYKIESQEILFDKMTTFSAVYVHTQVPPQEMNVDIYIDGGSPINKTVTPQASNRYKIGFYGRGTSVKVVITGNDLPKITRIVLEFN